MKEIHLSSENEILNIYEVFPIFSINSIVKFISLNIFSFIYYKNIVDLNFLNNIYNNIDNMPNLKYFELCVISKDINEDFLKKIIRKLLSINLDTCILKIQKNDAKSWNQDIYTKKELKEIFPKMKNFYLYDEISIRKSGENSSDKFDFEFY